MGFHSIKPLPSSDQIKSELVFEEQYKHIKQQRDDEIQRCLSSQSDKFLVIIGPCSAHHEDAVCDYVNRLYTVQQQTSDTLIIVPRIYTNKPRTMGTGYKGMLHQPDPSKRPNIVEGIQAIRRLHIRIIQETGLSGADEMLYPGNHPYLDDLLSYVAIGARSTENQQHRLVASGIDVPAGFKNPICGDMKVMLNSVCAAQSSHVFAYNGYEVATQGNVLAHAILRGAVDTFGNAIANYHYEELRLLTELYHDLDIKNPAVVVDTNHSNSGKKFYEQPRIALEIMRSRKISPDIKALVKGLMIESFIEEGSQKISDNVYGKSITDPCLGWRDTEKLLYEIADNV